MMGPVRRRMFRESVRGAPGPDIKLRLDDVQSAVDTLTRWEGVLLQLQRYSDEHLPYCVAPAEPCTCELPALVADSIAALGGKPTPSQTSLP